MNKQLHDFAVKTLKEGLALCTDYEQSIFKRMYSHQNLELPINVVVDNMEDEKLDWAMQQIQRTLDKKEKQ